MTEKQIKRFFEDRGMRIVDVAREMQKAFPSIKPESAEVMLRELLAGRRWYPTYADWLEATYGVTVSKPSFKNVRDRMKLAA